MAQILKKFHSIVALGIVLLVSFMSTGCSSHSSESATNKIKVTASLFPQYDFARQIAGDKAEISILLPPGSESHTYDPSPADILKISSSDIFLYTGKEMEPWADQIISSVQNDKLIIADVSSGIDLIESEHHNHHRGEHNHHEHEHEHSLDPHIWLDLTLVAKMVDNITSAFCEKDPQNSGYYKNNAENLKQELLELDADFNDMISTSRRKSIVFACRFAHLYFIKRYGFDYISAFDSCSTEAEPSVKKVAKILDFIEKNEIPAVYYEEFSEPKIANSIAEQTGVKTLKFSTLHNVTKEQLESGVTFVELMRENLENLRQGLN